MESQIIEDIANLLQSVQHNSMKTAALAILLFLVSCDAEDKQTSGVRVSHGSDVCGLVR